MQAILKFKLPEEETEYILAKSGPEYHAILFDLYFVFLHDALKYGHKYKTADKALEAVRDWMSERTANIPMEL